MARTALTAKRSGRLPGGGQGRGPAQSCEGRGPPSLHPPPWPRYTLRVLLVCLLRGLAHSVRSACVVAGASSLRSLRMRDCGGLLTSFAPRVGLRPFCRVLRLRQELFFPETAPTIPFQTQFDWVSYTPEVSSAIRPRRVPSAVHKTSAVVDLQGRLFEKAPGKGFFLEKR